MEVKWALTVRSVILSPAIWGVPGTVYLTIGDFLFRSRFLGSQNAVTGLLDSFNEIHISHGATRPFMLTKALHLLPGDVFPYKTAPVIHHLQQ